MGIIRDEEAMVEDEVNERIHQYFKEGKESKLPEFQFNLEDYVWMELISEKQNISTGKFMLQAIREKIVREQSRLWYASFIKKELADLIQTHLQTHPKKKKAEGRETIKGT